MFIVPIARMDGIVPSDSQKSSPAKGQAGPVPFKEMLRTAVKEARRWI